MLLAIGVAQHGHLGSLLTRAAISRRRTVAIEFGMCRSGRRGEPADRQGSRGERGSASGHYSIGSVARVCRFEAVDVSRHGARGRRADGSGPPLAAPFPAAAA
jgi:hypothetical protein